MRHFQNPGEWKLGRDRPSRRDASVGSRDVLLRVVRLDAPTFIVTYLHLPLGVNDVLAGAQQFRHFEIPHQHKYQFN